MTNQETAMRTATLRIIDRFCEQEGFATPELQETDNGRRVMFEGEAPDGRRFRLGYDRLPTWLPSSLSPGDVNDAGEILAMDGRLLSEGIIWVTPDQAARAVRFGWSIVDGMEGHNVSGVPCVQVEK